MSRNLLRFIALVMLVGSRSLLGQIDLNPPLTEDFRIMKDAYDDIKKGDTAKALGKLNAAPEAAQGLEKAELHTSRQLATMSYWLRNEEHPRTKDVARFALAQLTAAKGKFGAAEQADALAIAGGLYEDIIGSPAEARASYEAALKLNPSHAEARAALDRILAVEAYIKVRAAESEAIRRNAAK